VVEHPLHHNKGKEETSAKVLYANPIRSTPKQPQPNSHTARAVAKSQIYLPTHNSKAWFCRWGRKSETVWLGKAGRFCGVSKEKAGKLGEKEWMFLYEGALEQVLTLVRTCVSTRFGFLLKPMCCWFSFLIESSSVTRLWGLPDAERSTCLTVERYLHRRGKGVTCRQVMQSQHGSSRQRESKVWTGILTNDTTRTIYQLWSIIATQLYPWLAALQVASVSTTQSTSGHHGPS